MHGCKRNRLAWLLPCLTLFYGCAESPAPVAPVSAVESPRLASKFDAANTGTIRGQVVWTGALPIVPAFEIYAPLPQDHPGQVRLIRANPHVPAVDEASRGVVGAVLFLRGVDPAYSRPWDHAPVRIEQRHQHLHVVQGTTDSHIGFVQVGAEIEMVSREARVHLLRATGAVFFTLAFPDPEQPLKRRLSKKGLVELASAAGYFWMRGYLFVDEHPYYARTDAQGRFALPQVPAGRYQLVCWMPNWHKARHERDPESSLISRLYFRDPVEVLQDVTVERSTETLANVSLSKSLFER